MTKKLALCVAIMSFIVVLPIGQVEALDHAFAFRIGYQMFRSDEGWLEYGYLGDNSSLFNGRNYSLEWDMYPVDYFGLRFTMEYFQQNRRLEATNFGGNDSGQYDYERTLTIMPLTVAAKLRAPTPHVSPYVFAGFGFCYWGVYKSYGDRHWYSDDEDLDLMDEHDGMTFLTGVGIDFKLTRRVSFNIEGEFRSLNIEYYRSGLNEDLDASAVILTTAIMFN